MQKKLLGLAVAGALAAPGLALAQVEVYGFVNMSVGKFKYSESTAGAPSVSKWDVASHARSRRRRLPGRRGFHARRRSRTSPQEALLLACCNAAWRVGV